MPDLKKRPDRRPRARTTATRAWLGLGSNMGDRRGNLSAALRALSRAGQVEAVSSVYTSEPVGWAEQPWFWNLVVRLRTFLAPLDLLVAAQRIEHDLGRRRTRLRDRPRTIDIDILLYGDAVIRSKELTVPHASMLERAFVLRPLLEVDPELEYPATGVRIADVLRGRKLEKTRRLFPGSALLRGVTASLLLAGALACGGDGAERRAQRMTALADSLLPRLERLSGLEVREPVRVEFRTSAEVRRYVEERLDEELPPGVLDNIHTVYVMLGLVPDTLRLRELLMDLYTEQIAGYYDPVTRALHVVETATAAAIRPVMAHELVHALQDQHVDIDSLIDRSRGNDRQMAAQAALEGHATLVMFALLAEDAARGPVDVATLPDPGVQLRAAFESSEGDFPVFRRAPDIIRETLLFPYVAGASFVRQLWQGGFGGATAHTAPLGRWLPQSTEQVLDPLTRFADVPDAPTELRFEAPADGSLIYENSLGAFETRVLLTSHVGPSPTLGAGWDGDRYALLDAGGGARALVWVSVWDDAQAADAFVSAFDGLVARGRLPAEGRVQRLDLEGRPGVRIVLTRGTEPEAVAVPGAYCVDATGNRAACAQPAAAGAVPARFPSAGPR